MSLLFHAINFVKVNRNGGTVTAECTLLNNDVEAVAWLDASVKTLQISRAGWANYGAPNYDLGIFDLPELIGIEAYLTGGPALRRALGGPDQELPYELISECFRAVLQSETFFFLERVFQSADQYDDFCEKHSVGACRYYTHIDQVEKHWTDWLDTTEREYNLFNRSKTVIIKQLDSNRIVNAVFHDSFHHIGVQLELDQQGTVLDAQANFHHAPDPICFLNHEHLPKMVGSILGKMGKKDIAARVGGSEGCSHLVDLLYEVKKSL